MLDERPKCPIPQGDLEAIATVASFLVHAENESRHMMFGGYDVGEAIDAMAHLVGCSGDDLRQIGRR